MEATCAVNSIKATCCEIMTWRSWVVGIFISTSLSAVAVGVYWPERNESSLSARVGRLRLQIEALKLIIGKVNVAGRCLYD